MLLSIAFLLFLVTNINSCEQRSFPSGLVCVCNEKTCDTVPNVGELSGDDIQVLFTSPADPGITSKPATFGGQQDPTATLITIDSAASHQKIIGFGGAFTDAAGININKLSSNLQDKLISSYFSDDGIEYNICRVPLGACDFSPRMYTMDDNADDFNLEKFALQEEDLNYKIPVIQKAFSLRGDKPLNLFASAWTAPLWMKDVQVWSRGSVLKPEFYQTWADYHVKFFDEYLKHGVKFWGLTVGNEPIIGFMKKIRIPSMGWTTTAQSVYIKKNLGPTLKNSVHKDLKVMIHDDSVNVLPFMVPPMLDDDEVLQYVDGVAMHWYQDNNYQPEIRKLAFSTKKDTFVLETETCHFVTTPDLGSWPRAADYIDNIMTDLEWNYNGWVEWNLALDISGGPTQINEPADAPIVISEDFSEFYKQPTFYAIGHFSKYILPDSVRITATSDNNVRALAFLRPDNVKVVTVYNAATNSASIQINDGTRYSSKIDVPAQSINTILYKA